MAREVNCKMHLKESGIPTKMIDDVTGLVVYTK